MAQPPATKRLKNINPVLNSQVANSPRDWIDELANSLGRCISKTIAIYGLLTRPPVKVSLASLKTKSMQMMDGVERRYVPNGCHARAVLLSEKIEQAFFSGAAMSIFLESESPLEVTCGDFQGVCWSYHIAAAVLAGNGKVYVLDPVVNRDQPVELALWINHFKIGEYCYLRIGFAEEFQAISGQKEVVLEHAQSLCDQHQSRMNNFDRHFQPPFSADSPVQVAPFYAYSLEEDEDLHYSFSQIAAANCESSGILVDLALLSYRLSGSNQSQPLFYIEYAEGEWQIQPRSA